jgi:hypothetical protein
MHPDFAEVAQEAGVWASVQQAASGSAEEKETEVNE